MAVNKGGRPVIKWTDKEYKQFENLCAIQCTQEEICSVMGVTDKTLNRLLKSKYNEGFSEVFKKKSVSGKASLRRWQYEAAKKGNTSMLIWLGKQYLGQTDKTETSISEDTDLVFNIKPASTAPKEETED